MSGGKILDKIEIDYRDINSGDILTAKMLVFDSHLARKWLSALNQLLKDGYHLEKNYCFLGWSESLRDGEKILSQVNNSIQKINEANLGYTIDDYFSMDNTLQDGDVGDWLPGRKVVEDKMNWLHRYFEDLQGVSGRMSTFVEKASPEVRWHIRQLNLLCHEFECWAMSYRKLAYAPEWQRPSQLMCWLNAPRFVLDEKDFESFGIETLNRPLGGVHVGVNKAVGKHHWEVFNDENRNVDELITTTLRSQTEAAGDFDIEWAQNPAEFWWQKDKLDEFRKWLIVNGFDPEDKSLTIGHPLVGQIDLLESFGSTDFQTIWKLLYQHLDVFAIRTSDAKYCYDYHWMDDNYMQQQVDIISGKK